MPGASSDRNKRRDRWMNSLRSNSPKTHRRSPVQQSDQLTESIIRLETKSGRILPLTFVTKYDLT